MSISNAGDSAWANDFQLDLKQALCEELASWIEVSFDCSPPCIERNAYGSSLFVAILSPDYLTSTLARQELASFNDRNRMIVIELLPIDEANCPPQLRGLRRERFWWQAEGTPGLCTKLGRKSNSNLYKARLQTLADDLATMLRSMSAAGISQKPFELFDQQRQERNAGADGRKNKANLLGNQNADLGTQDAMTAVRDRPSEPSSDSLSAPRNPVSEAGSAQRPIVIQDRDKAERERLPGLSSPGLAPLAASHEEGSPQVNGTAHANGTPAKVPLMDQFLEPARNVVAEKDQSHAAVTDTSWVVPFPVGTTPPPPGQMRPRNAGSATVEHSSSEAALDQRSRGWDPAPTTAVMPLHNSATVGEIAGELVNLRDHEPAKSARAVESSDFAPHWQVSPHDVSQPTLVGAAAAFGAKAHPPQDDGVLDARVAELLSSRLKTWLEEDLRGIIQEMVRAEVASVPRPRDQRNARHRLLRTIVVLLVAGITWTFWDPLASLSHDAFHFLSSLLPS